MSAVTQATARAALAHHTELQAQVAEIRAERDETVEWLREQGYTVADTDANFALFGPFEDREAIFNGLGKAATPEAAAAIVKRLETSAGTGGEAAFAALKTMGSVAEPALVPSGPKGVLEAAEGAALIVVGLSERWRTEGLGEARVAVARDSRVPTLLVRHGLRPGGLAPPETMTRFTWTLAAR